MRRIASILALLVVLVATVATAATAYAHPGIEDPYVPQGQETTVVLGVPSEEQAPMTQVDVVLPADFKLVRLDQTPGWQGSSGPGELRFTGGNAPQGTYVQFTFAGVFEKRRVIELPVTTHAADGLIRQWNQAPTDPWPAALIFPGYPRGQAPIPGVPGTGTGGGQGHKVLVWGGRAIVVAVAITVVALMLARRRRRAQA
ncbi:MAG TPA: hypothetical protein VLL25_19475, partial [Acidimicrobiales bacterium]|nr:hypothetical protein [Acidimicrobiales bacterium]